MNSGGGVFATGDHTDIGYAMCGRLPRIRPMRDWTSTPMGVEGAPRARDRIDTIVDPGVEGRYEFEDQSDATPQRIYPNYEVTWAGNVWSAGIHPLLRLPPASRNRTDSRHFTSDMDVLPDHAHESICLEISPTANPEALDGIYDLTDERFPNSPTAPRKGSASGPRSSLMPSRAVGRSRETACGNRPSTRACSQSSRPMTAISPTPLKMDRDRRGESSVTPPGIISWTSTSTARRHCGAASAREGMPNSGHRPTFSRFSAIFTTSSTGCSRPVGAPAGSPAIWSRCDTTTPWSRSFSGRTISASPRISKALARRRCASSTPARAVAPPPRPSTRCCGLDSAKSGIDRNREAPAAGDPPGHLRGVRNPGVFGPIDLERVHEDGFHPDPGRADDPAGRGGCRIPVQARPARAGPGGTRPLISSPVLHGRGVRRPKRSNRVRMAPGFGELTLYRLRVLPLGLERPRQAVQGPAVPGCRFRSSR